jgi:hypothetical protein
MATLRPAYLILGVLAMARQWLALRAPGRPFKPMAWVHRLPCEFDDDEPHDVEHHVNDDCVPDDWPDHALEYERNLDVIRSFTDNFDVRVGRLYRWTALES